MKVALVHNYYQQPGGEDEVFAAEGALLEAHGHEVVRYTAHNDEVKGMNRAALARSTVWNGERYRELRALFRKVRPQVVHVHNTLPLISPAVYDAARAEGAAVVQSLHNPRLLCPSANFYRNGQLCTACLGKHLAWPGVLHRCYRDSALQTLGIAGMIAAHRVAGTWTKMVDRYIVFTKFYRELFIQGGLPGTKIEVKSHFIHPDPGASDAAPAGYALYVGRLDPEKGVRTMIRAWEYLKRRGIDFPLKVRGGGQLLNELRGVVEREGLNVEFVPRLARPELNTLIRRANVLVWPSEGYYETFGLVAAEAYACGVPVVASETGVAVSMISHGRTGLHFRAGDPEDLAAQLEWALAHPAELSVMRRAARAEYEAKYTAEVNYRQLMAIYERAMRPLARQRGGG